eukprot:COSAG02_NODE_778_length_17288_cov_102.024725_21_plen_119_part_00
MACVAVFAAVSFVAWFAIGDPRVASLEPQLDFNGNGSGNWCGFHSAECWIPRVALPAGTATVAPRSGATATVAAGPRKTAGIRHVPRGALHLRPADRSRVPDRRENEKTAYAQKPRSI